MLPYERDHITTMLRYPNPYHSPHLFALISDNLPLIRVYLRPFFRITRFCLLRYQVREIIKFTQNNPHRLSESISIVSRPPVCFPIYSFV